jgi:hypothetical protein
MNRIDLSQLGGFPFTQKTLDFFQTYITDAFTAVGKLIGDKKIITGVENVGGTVSDGWVVIDGELLFFQGGAVGTDVIVVETPDAVQATFEDTTTKDVYFSRVATFGSGVGSFPYTELTRLQPIEEAWQEGDVKQVNCDAAYITANFDANGIGTNLRKGWAICNGYGGLTMDLRGKFVAAYSDSDAAFDLGASGGAKTVTLVKNNLPSIQLKLPFEKSNNAFAAGTATVPRLNGGVPTLYDGNSLLTEVLGSDTPIDKLPPYKVLLFIQKVNIQ